MRALNIYGWGNFSNDVSIKASTVPTQITTISTSIDPASGGVLVQWAAPDPQGETILSYLIEIANSPALTAWYQDTTYCPGLDPSLTYCIIPMLTL